MINNRLKSHYLFVNLNSVFDLVVSESVCYVYNTHSYRKRGIWGWPQKTLVFYGQDNKRHRHLKNVLAKLHYEGLFYIRGMKQKNTDIFFSSFLFFNIIFSNINTLLTSFN